MKEKLIEFVQKNGIRTGSFHFGCENWDDKDFVISDSQFESFKITMPEKWMEYLLYNFESETQEYQFLSFRIGLINIIIKPDDEIESWKTATRLFKLMAKQSKTFKKLIEEKEMRVAIFSSMRDNLEIKEKIEVEKEIEDDYIPF